ncbi:MAG: ABC transporter substrate-binding protein [Actinomycetia bacterium]|nr:ABC transporter substrate-binding protein [Actinomycetes bacterium]
MLRKSVRPFWLGATTMLLAGALAGCSSAVSTGSTATPAAAPGVDAKTKTITVGASTPFTGPATVYSEINMGAAAYFKAVDAKGGIDGWKINYTLLDDGYNPAKNLANVQTLVKQDHVFAIVVNQGTPTNVAAAHFLANTNVPVVGPAEGAPALSHYPNYFVLMPNYAWEAGLAAQYAVQKLGATKVGILYENDDLGIPAKTGAEAELKALGLSPVAAIPFEVTTTDFSPYVGELASKGAQAVLLWGANPNAAAALRAANQIGFHPKWLMAFWIADPSTYKLAGSLLDGVYFPMWFQPLGSRSPAMEAYKAAMRTYEPSTPIGSLAENGYTEASLFGYALKELLDQHKAITQANLIQVLDSLHNADIGTAQGVSFSAADHTSGIHSERIVQAQNGQFVAITGLLPFPPAAVQAVGSGSGQ